MLKKIILFAFFLFTTFCCFSQDSTGKTRPKTFMIVLTQLEVNQLFNFIMTADNFSDKGKEAYIRDLQKKIYLIPDSTAVRNKQNLAKKKN